MQIYEQISEIKNMILLGFYKSEIFDIIKRLYSGVWEVFLENLIFSVFLKILDFGELV